MLNRSGSLLRGLLRRLLLIVYLRWPLRLLLFPGLWRGLGFRNRCSLLDFLRGYDTGLPGSLGARLLHRGFLLRVGSGLLLSRSSWSSWHNTVRLFRLTGVLDMGLCGIIELDWSLGRRFCGRDCAVALPGVSIRVRSAFAF